MRALPVLVATALLAVVGSLCCLAMAAGIVTTAPNTSGEVSGPDVAGIPGALASVYVDAAGRYCDGLPWEVLAGIGWIESRHGAGDFDPGTGEMKREILGPPLDGSHGTIVLPDPSSGDGWAHAEGPMQFLPSTWRRWATLAPNRPGGAEPSPHNLWDAIHSAARMLCGGRPHLADVERALYGYNHDWDYVAAVLTQAARYRTAVTAIRPTMSTTTAKNPASAGGSR